MLDSEKKNRSLCKRSLVRQPCDAQSHGPARSVRQLDPQLGLYRSCFAIHRRQEQKQQKEISLSSHLTVRCELPRLQTRGHFDRHVAQTPVLSAKRHVVFHLGRKQEYRISRLVHYSDESRGRHTLRQSNAGGVGDRMRNSCLHTGCAAELTGAGEVLQRDKPSAPNMSCRYGRGSFKPCTARSLPSSTRTRSTPGPPPPPPPPFAAPPRVALPLAAPWATLDPMRAFRSEPGIDGFTLRLFGLLRQPAPGPGPGPGLYGGGEVGSEARGGAGETGEPGGQSVGPDVRLSITLPGAGGGGR
jgi:hypothetical protein